MSMSNLETELPDIAEEIRRFAKVHDVLKEALADFNTACAFEATPQVSEAERREWTRIRLETAQELRRIMSRLNKPLEGTRSA